MSTAKINTLRQINIAINLIDQAANLNTDPGTALSLEKISAVLENIKNDIISKTEKDLVEAMGSDTRNLYILIEEINKEDAQLDTITETVRSVSKTIGVLVNITTAAMSVGLL